VSNTFYTIFFYQILEIATENEKKKLFQTLNLIMISITLNKVIIKAISRPRARLRATYLNFGIGLWYMDFAGRDLSRLWHKSCIFVSDTETCSKR
jgi:hypothetical protein